MLKEFFLKEKKFLRLRNKLSIRTPKKTYKSFISDAREENTKINHRRITKMNQQQYLSEISNGRIQLFNFLFY